ncbi:hypothetical protein BJ508DRAFT_315694 [Ascobolus immersus RN42]|uniref:DUF6532 domain-containing protein n=1 Tax=Ascobolus immersus RN42 TaxID=1160509 RepID=A0A3N4HDM6_ASCIM|nr:hypothetical protein BJ508DRAFT_315694 [Ascobolus immersus RN42]
MLQLPTQHHRHFSTTRYPTQTTLDVLPGLLDTGLRKNSAKPLPGPGYRHPEYQITMAPSGKGKRAKRTRSQKEADTIDATTPPQPTPTPPTKPVPKSTRKRSATARGVSTVPDNQEAPGSNEKQPAKKKRVIPRAPEPPVFLPSWSKKKLQAESSKYALAIAKYNDELALSLRDQSSSEDEENQEQVEPTPSESTEPTRLPTEPLPTEPTPTDPTPTDPLPQHDNPGNPQHTWVHPMDAQLDHSTSPQVVMDTSTAPQPMASSPPTNPRTEFLDNYVSSDEEDDFGLKEKDGDDTEQGQDDGDFLHSQPDFDDSLVDPALRMPPPPQHPLPDQQVRSTHFTSITGMEQTSALYKRLSATPAPHTAAATPQPSTSSDQVHTDESVDLPGGASVPTGGLQRASSTTPSPAGAQVGNEEKKRKSRAISGLITPNQVLIYEDPEVVTQIWRTICFKSPFPDNSKVQRKMSTRYRDIWINRALAHKVTAHFDFPAIAALAKKSEQIFRSFHEHSRPFIVKHYLKNDPDDRVLVATLLEHNRFASNPKFHAATPKVILQTAFTAPQIVNFICTFFYDNGKTPGRYIDAEHLQNLMNGVFLCFITSTLQLALNALLTRSTFQTAVHRNYYAFWMERWEILNKRNLAADIVVSIGKQVRLKAKAIRLNSSSYALPAQLDDDDEEEEDDQDHIDVVKQALAEIDKENQSLVKAQSKGRKKQK